MILRLKSSSSSNRGAFGTAFVGGALGAAAGLATFELGKVSYPYHQLLLIYRIKKNNILLK